MVELLNGMLPPVTRISPNFPSHSLAAFDIYIYICVMFHLKPNKNMKNLKMKVAALLGGMALMAVLAVFPQEKAEAQWEPPNCELGRMITEVCDRNIPYWPCCD